jgi:branched-chain amino acid transport system substrate-binding protein
MTIGLYIPFNTGVLLISDRLNTIYGNQKVQVDKIVQIDENTVMSFCGSTEHCKYIIDIIKQKSRELGIVKISEIIRDTLYELRKESGFSDDLEFIVVRNYQKIRVWKLLNGVSNELEPDSNHAMGLYSSIIPHLELFSTRGLSKEDAIRFGIDLVGWVSRIENKVGSLSEYGCNICLINSTGIVIDKIFDDIKIQNMLYRFEVEEEPLVSPLAGKQILFGFIASDTTSLETAKPYLEQIIAPDINNYIKGLGYNYKVQFLIDDAQGRANIHLEKIQGFHSMGVNLVIGGGWSSQAQASLNYVNDNNMLLVSTSSGSPILAIPNDRLFRMCPSDTHLAPALAAVMWAAGVKSIVILQRGDSWGDGIINQFVPIWMAKGGTIAGDKIRYAAEATDFSNYLTVADEAVKTAVAQNNGETQRVGVVILSFNEISVILKQVSSYPNIYNVHWWGSDGTAKSQRAMDDAPVEANHIGIYSLLSRETLTPLYSTLESRYVALTKQQYSTYNAYLYDAAFAIVKAVIETGSTDASKVSAAFPVICNSMFGASGWCRLDSAGDRAAPPYDVWGFYPSATKASVSVIMAQYDPDTQKTIFVISVLGFTPIGP